MLKRIVFAVVLAGSSDQPVVLESGDQELVISAKLALLGALLGAELIFVILRFAI